MSGPNLLLDAAIERAGMSHAGIASRVNTARPDLGLRHDHASVARWVRDHAIPRPPVPELICEILSAALGGPVTLSDIGMDRTGHSAPETLDRAVDQAAALWRGDLKGRGPRTSMTGAAAIEPVWTWENPPEDRDLTRLGHNRVTAFDVERLVRARGIYQEMYRRVGGVPTRPRIVALLNNEVAPLLRAAYDDPLGRRLFRAAAGLAAFAGVCAYDGDEQPIAQRHFFHALRLAKASGDRGHGGYVVALLANQALFRGDCRLVVQYAQTALRAAGTELGSSLITDLHALAAKAYARMGDGVAARAHLRESEAAVARVSFGSGQVVEHSYVAPGLVETQAAEALRRIGDLSAALDYAEESVRTAPLTHLRGQVHRYGGLALVLADRGEAEHAAHIGGQMLDLAEGMESGRIRDRIGTVVQALRPARPAPGVGEFLERATWYTTEQRGNAR
ncbi:hypothetical protein AB0M43_36395 [Longispora sp. NPDC051575]|uniref:hypothetical protein n=1 Tax=Longispora sp. NPDC051575 TaxID=3154943 RepID=UPI00343A23EF